MAQYDFTLEDIKGLIEASATASEQRLMKHMDVRFAKVDQQFSQVRLDTAEVITRLGDYMEEQFAEVKAGLKEIKRDAKALERVVAQHSHDIMKLRAA